MKRFANLLGLALFCLYLHLFYYVLLVPAFAEFSFYAFLVVPLALGGFWLVPRPQRMKAAVITLLFIFMEQAFANIIQMKPLQFTLSVIVIVLFISFLMWHYVKLHIAKVAVVSAVALAFNLLIPAPVMLALPEFYPRWISEPQYIGEFQGKLPLAVADLQGDGKDRIILLGNRDYYPDGRKLPQTYKLYEEPLRVMAWEWQGNEMARVPDEQLESILEAEQSGQIDDSPFRLTEWLSKAHPGYPYYILNEHYELEPLVQRKSLAEGMLQFGTAPYQIMAVNMENIQRQLERNGGAFDRLAAGGRYTDVVIHGGLIEGFYDGLPFSAPTTATQIIGTARMAGGEDAILLKGLHLELLQMIDGELVVTHTLTREMQRDLSYSQIQIDDINADGVDEIIIAYPYTSILSPQPDGSWQVLWGTHTSSFHIKTIGHLAADKKQEILALSKSKVRASGTNYLTSYTYTDEGLKQNWKIFSRNVETAALADLQGNGKNDLVVTFAGSSAIYVLAKHSIPVTTITIVLTALLYGGLIGRRVRHAKQNKQG